MPGFKTEGIVLKRRNFGEADRILTVFSQKQGKVTVLAKGVRKITSRRAGNVELLNRAVMFLYPGKNFLILTEAESLNTYEKLKTDLNLQAAAFHILELVDRLTAENQENIVLYNHLVEVLEKLSKNPRQIFIRAFEVKILSDLGFANFQKESPEQEILSILENSSWDEIGKMELNPQVGMELERILGYYLERILEGKLKSKEIFKK